MAAPVGNQFWKARSSHGRTPIFGSAEELWAAACEYFEWVEANPILKAEPFAYRGIVTIHQIPNMRAMTIDGLCIFLEIARRTWDGYRERKDFLPVTTRVDAIIRTQKFEGAAAGLLNANIIARDLGLADRSDYTGKDGAPMQVQAEVADRSAYDLARRIAYLLAKGAGAVPQDIAGPSARTRKTLVEG